MWTHILILVGDGEWARMRICIREDEIVRCVDMDKASMSIQ